MSRSCVTIPCARSMRCTNASVSAWPKNALRSLRSRASLKPMSPTLAPDLFTANAGVAQVVKPSSLVYPSEAMSIPKLSRMFSKPRCKPLFGVKWILTASSTPTAGEATMGGLTSAWKSTFGSITATTGSSKASDMCQRHRVFLERCQASAGSVPWCAKRQVRAASQGDRVSLQPPTP